MSQMQDAEPAIAPLVEGEERWMQQVHRPDGNRNDIFVRRRLPGDEVSDVGRPINVVAVIRATDDTHDGSAPWAWQQGADEREVYIRIAEAFVNAPPPPGVFSAVHPDVQWFIDRIR